MDRENTFFNQFVCDNNDGIFVIVVSFFYSYYNKYVDCIFVYISDSNKYMENDYFHSPHSVS